MIDLDAFTAIKNVATTLGYPCSPNQYTGKESRYIEYNYAVINGGNFGDDRPECNVASVQVHLYLPKKENFLTRMKALQAALFDAGFTWPAVTTLTENDEVQTEEGGNKQPLDAVRHIVFSCEYEEEI